MPQSAVRALVLPEVVLGFEALASFSLFFRRPCSQQLRSAFLARALPVVVLAVARAAVRSPCTGPPGSPLLEHLLSLRSLA